MTQIVAPSQLLIENAEHKAGFFPSAKIFYSADGTEALVVSGDADESYIVSVDEDDHTTSATTTEWSTGFEA